eukprot:c18821_g1_i2.p1 GENE.c18821_g1_i2~~c18821_g1_i2.p1  ORF type:complete len:416 (-),score=81.01 c18821_g1_i2:31-1278(-)
MVTIHFQTLKGDKFDLDVDLEKSAEHLKERIKREKRINIKTMIQSQTIIDSSKISDHGLKEGDRVILIEGYKQEARIDPEPFRSTPKRNMEDRIRFDPLEYNSSTLVDMGFTSEEAKEALVKNSNLSDAIDDLTKSHIEKLKECGVKESKARELLKKARNNLNAATNMFFEEQHEEEEEEMQGEEIYRREIPKQQQQQKIPIQEIYKQEIPIQEVPRQQTPRKPEIVQDFLDPLQPNNTEKTVPRRVEPKMDISEENISQIMDMGFTRAQAVGALKETKNNTAAALDLIFQFPDRQFNDDKVERAEKVEKREWTDEDIRILAQQSEVRKLLNLIKMSPNDVPQYVDYLSNLPQYRPLMTPQFVSRCKKYVQTNNFLERIMEVTDRSREDVIRAVDLLGEKDESVVITYLLEAWDN